MTNEEMKVAMMKALEGSIDELLKAREGKKHLTLTEIEDMVLAARQDLGQKLTEQLVNEEASTREHATPVSKTNGKRLESKGKKTRRSRRG